jgi:aminoglycoside phosphotransferase (APT) family kinase protein
VDEEALDAWLGAHVSGFDGLVAVRQFQGGQSNPTYLVEGRSSRCVLRKRPPGPVLATAHAIDREWRVMSALAETAVPVPRMLAYCDDSGVIGTAFFVMEHVAGRVFVDPALPDCMPDERRSVYREMMQVLAALHRVSPRAVGLEGFGNPQGFLRRQVERWTRQYRLSEVPNDAMDRLIPWLARRVPLADIEGLDSAIVHGDFRIGNLIVDEASPRVRAVLDWELATLGNAFADLAYSCLAWRVPTAMNGLANADASSLPGEAELLSWYEEASGRRLPDDFEFYIVFSLFRWAAILSGVYRRALAGNAADARGLDAGKRFEAIAEIAWASAQGPGAQSAAPSWPANPPRPET